MFPTFLSGLKTCICSPREEDSRDRISCFEAVIDDDLHFSYTPGLRPALDQEHSAPGFDVIVQVKVEVSTHLDLCLKRRYIVFRVCPRDFTCSSLRFFGLRKFFGVDDKVNRLRKSLTQELSLRNALNRGFHRALGSLPRIPNNLPVQVCFSDSML